MALSHYASILLSFAGGSMMIAVRLRASNRPVTLRKIVLPPIGMATGFMMFLLPAFRFPWEWGLGAFAVGVLLISYPLIRCTRLEQREGSIYLQRSKAFLAVIIGMLALRLALHNQVEKDLGISQTAGMFFVLAFGMILSWRTAMLIAYLRLTKAGKKLPRQVETRPD